MTVAKFIDSNGNIIPFGLGQSGGPGPKGDKGDPGGWVITPKAKTETHDFNTFTVSGIYKILSDSATNGGNLLNAPIAVHSDWMLEVFDFSSGQYTGQRATRFHSPSLVDHGIVFQRTQLSPGSWSPWYRYPASGARGGPDIVGTGMPNGAVVASPGTYYTDTAGTNGAWRWLKKSGTGSTGWDVVHGDTGWRNVRSDPVFASAFESPDVEVSVSLYARRTLNTVELSMVGVKFTAASSYTDGPIPVGWRSRPNVAYMITASGPQPARAFVTHNNIHWSLSAQLANGAASFSGAFMYITDDPWPTVLPGTPY